MPENEEQEDKPQLSYYKFHRIVFELRPTADELAVLTVLFSHDFNNKHRFFVYPSIDRIRDKVIIDRDLCAEVLQCLHDAGVLTIVKRKRNRGKAQNAYILKDFETMDSVYVKELAGRLITAREVMRNRLKLKREKKRQRKGQVNPFAIIGTSDYNISGMFCYNTEERTGDNIKERIGFNIAAHTDDNIKDCTMSNIEERPGRNINNSINNDILISEQAHENDFEILGKKKIMNKTYTFKSNGLVYCTEDQKDYSALALKEILPKTHGLLKQIDKLYQ